MGRNLHWSIILASEDQHPAGRRHSGRACRDQVRLRRDTLDFIYGQANERNIPVAQVIEEATEALKRERARLG